MATIVTQHGTEEWLDSDTRVQAYNALQAASERMGRNNYNAGLAAHVKSGRKASTYQYTPTDEHREVIAAMSDVLRDKISPEDAMCLIHQYDVFLQRVRR